MARRQIELSNAGPRPSWPGPATRCSKRSREPSTPTCSCAATSSRSTARPRRSRPRRQWCARSTGWSSRATRSTPAPSTSVAGALAEHESPAKILDDVVWRHRNVRVAPKSVNQKRYVDAIRNYTITFGIGPAGTGKTFLAIAMAVAALSRREVNRIILTRPAVEAGERLGFLPGDLMAKVDPYLRPLFDALHDMMDPERVTAHLEKGVDRGRAAGVHARPRAAGRPAGAHAGRVPADRGAAGRRSRRRLRRAADAGARRLPTGAQERSSGLRAQDGASTLCCAEHLWHVTTPADRRRGKPGRVLETREMIGRLAVHHQHRFELPLVVAPVEFEPRDVPMDPYALGLLLGDGCLTTKTTPTLHDRRSGAGGGARGRARRHRAAAQDRRRLRPPPRGRAAAAA